MSLLVNVSFSAMLSRAEQALLAALPDWPTQQKLSDAERTLAPRLIRLGCIEIERCKDDPIQGHFDTYAGVTFVGRRAVSTGVVRIDPRAPVEGGEHG